MTVSVRRTLLDEKGFPWQPLVFLILGIIIVLSAFNTAATLRFGLSPDEQMYMLMTKELAAGHALYHQFIDHQPPGVAIAGVPFVWLFGSTTTAATSAIVVYDLLLVASVAVIAYKLQLPRVVVLGAACLTATYTGQMHGFDVSSYSAIFTATALACGLVGGLSAGRRVYAGLFWGGLVAWLGFMTTALIAL